MPDNFDPKKILAQEQKGKLFFVGAEFYTLAQKYIQELEDELKKTDKTDFRYAFVEDQLIAGQKIVSAIIVLRINKIIKEAATQTFMQAKKEPESMTVEERGLFDALFQTLASWKKRYLEEIVYTMDKVLAVKTPSVEAPTKSSIKDYILVRMLCDVPTFVGMDMRNYSLRKEDMATVPAVNGQALIAKSAAVRVIIGKEINRKQ